MPVTGSHPGAAGPAATASLVTSSGEGAPFHLLSVR
jgi:hypothetical protein